MLLRSRKIGKVKKATGGGNALCNSTACQKSNLKSNLAAVLIIYFYQLRE